MSIILEIPLQPTPQTLAVSLLNVTYNLGVWWNDDPAAQCWMLDISDAQGNPILLGVPMITGIDLLEQYEYLGLGFHLIVQTDNDVDAVPTFANLGSNGHLYVAVEP